MGLEISTIDFIIFCRQHRKVGRGAEQGMILIAALGGG